MTSTPLRIDSLHLRFGAEEPAGACRAVLFDMDGVLVDSEPFWQQAEREVFATVGLDLSPEDMSLTIGLRIEEVAAFWHRRHPWRGPSLEEVAADVVDRVIELVEEQGELMAGVSLALESIRRRGLPLALASSSSRRIIETVFARFDLAGLFAAVASAEDETHGKPHPAVFLTAASALGVAAPDCLVVEDSLNGVIAAKAARMKCLAVPDPRQRDDPRFVLADGVVDSLADLDESDWSRWLE
jgi:sugar-phosphatase